MWNQAGTYEEKNVSEWAREALETALLRASFTAASGEWSVRVAGGKDMKGDAEIVAMRGKRRHIFEFSFTLKWEVVFTGDGGGGGGGGKKVRGGAGVFRGVCTGR